jgi:signal transduction histidine kinase/CheY-like chemotaxis protein
MARHVGHLWRSGFHSNMTRRKAPKKQASVSKRFNAALAAVVASALLVFALILIISDFVTASRDLEGRTQGLARLAAETLEIPMWNLNDVTVSDIVSSFLKDENIVYMAVYDNGKQVASHVQQSFAQNSPEYLEDSDNFLIGTAPIVHDAQTIGEVRLSVSRQPILLELATNVALMLAVTVLTLLAIVATSGLITRRYITRRLLGLEDAATAIAGGDLDASIDKGPDDEIGTLARNLGVMRDSIKRLVDDLRASKDQLQLQNVTLGERVRERTAELEQAMIAAREAQRLAEGANRAKSDFLSNMSHELRTPLNAIIGFTEFVMENDEEPLTEEQSESLSQVLTAGRHLLMLINDVLDLAKIEAGTISLAIESVDAGQIIDECVSLTQSFAAGRNVVMHNCVASDALPSVAVDRLRFKQVFLNLLSNAIKYNKATGKVFIETTPGSEGALRIGVRDEGPGMSEDQLAKLFDPFDRLGAENSTIEGTGIGMTITKRLVEQMGGKISVDSTAGVGTAFWLDLPVSSRPIREAGTESDKECARNANALVLYIEDNPASLDLVSRIMRIQPGIDFIGASSGETGIARARAEIPDVVLLDINLPGVDGYKVLETLHAAPETRHTPVIALTAAALDSNVRRGIAAGFFDYLTKPVAARDLMSAIRRALDRGASDESDRPTPPSGKVLVVDDTPVNLAITRRQLSKLDVPCDTFQDPVQALEELKAGDYAAALVDVGMPVLDGLELTRRLRASERESGAHTPVIALTADYGRAGEIARCRNAGMDDQLTKPVKLEELALTLHRWFATSEHAASQTPPAGEASPHG